MLFEFNTYSGLLLPAVLHGLLFSVLLFFRGWREARLADRVLAITVLVFTLRVASWMLGFAGWYDSHDAHTTFMFYFPWSNFFLYGPLLYFYFRSLTNANFTFKSSHLIHFIPALLHYLGAGITFLNDLVINHWILAEELPYFFNTQGALRNLDFGWWSEVWNTLSYLHMLVYFGMTLVAFRQYRRYLRAHFSDLENLRFNWLRYLLIAFLAAQLVWILSLAIDTMTVLELSYIDYWYSYAVWGVVIYVLSIAGYASHAGFLRKLEFLPRRPAATTERSPELEDQGEWEEKLVRCMEDEKPWLQPDLTLAELAGKLNMPTATLSRIINTGFSRNFNDFVNEYRVREMQQKMLDPNLSHFSLLGIAFECGFRSKATFNRAFRKHVGVSPSQYLQQQRATG